MAPSNVLLRPAEVARRLGISVSTTRRWIRTGLIKAIPLGRLVGVPSQEVDRLIAEGCGAFRRS